MTSSVYKFVAHLFVKDEVLPVFEKWRDENAAMLDEDSIAILEDELTSVEGGAQGNEDNGPSASDRAPDFRLILNSDSKDVHFIPLTFPVDETRKFVITFGKCGQHRNMDCTLERFKYSLEAFVKTRYTLRLSNSVAELLTKKSVDRQLEKAFDAFLMIRGKQLTQLTTEKKTKQSKNLSSAATTLMRISTELKQDNICVGPKLNSSTSVLMFQLPEIFVSDPELINDVVQETKDVMKVLEDLQIIIASNEISSKEQDELDLCITRAVAGNDLLAVLLLLGLREELGVRIPVLADGKTLLHICGDQEIMKHLLELGHEVVGMVDQKDNLGRTPLEQAFVGGRIGCANLLVNEGANVNHMSENENKYLIHMALEVYERQRSEGLDLVKLLVTSDDIDLNVTDIQKRTALAQFVEQRSGSDVSSCLFDSVGRSDACDVEMMVLLGADINTADTSTGNTALHLAVQKQNVQMVKLLLRLSVDVDVLNNDAKLPFDLAMTSGDAETLRLLSTTDLHSTKVTTKVTVPCDGPRVLCLDGGGTRGIIELVILMEIEQMTGKKIHELFDVVAGTSTGSLIALSVASKENIPDVLRRYYNLADRIFKGYWPRPTENLQAEAKKILGEKTFEDLSLEDVLITSVVATHSDFCKVFSKRNTPKMLTWKAATASASAPFYFEPFTDDQSGRTYLDGGLAAHNPTMETMSYLISKGRKPKAILSLSTGAFATDYDADDFYLGSGMGYFSIARNVGNALNLFNLMYSSLGSFEQMHYQCASLCSGLGIPYLRLDPALAEEVSMECTDQAMLRRMESAVKFFLKTPKIQKELRGFCKLLVL